jgi:hypothetical protein
MRKGRETRKKTYEHTDTRQRRKPSETLCPANVAIMEALWPAHNSAKANKSAAARRYISAKRSKYTEEGRSYTLSNGVPD